jgi:hypothetical protein
MNLIMALYRVNSHPRTGGPKKKTPLEIIATTMPQAMYIAQATGGISALY